MLSRRSFGKGVAASLAGAVLVPSSVVKNALAVSPAACVPELPVVGEPILIGTDSGYFQLMETHRREVFDAYVQDLENLFWSMPGGK